MKKLFILGLYFPIYMASAQDASDKPVKYRKTMPIHFEISSGFNNSKFIDFATSPLYYSGMMKHLMLSIRKETPKREVLFSASNSFGNYSLDYNSIEVASNPLFNGGLRYSRLYQLNVIPNSKWNLKIGGTLDLRGLARLNPALMNNQFGFDVFGNVMASGKITRDISNSAPKKFWFVKLKTKQRRLMYQLDMGVINTNFRNGFIYSNSGGVYNENSIIAGHTLTMFSGFRMASRLDYEHSISNNNSLKVSYLWDAMMTGDKNVERMQLVNNMFIISLNFKLR